MCTGRVDPEFPLRAFLAGADGVFVGGCRLGECHYATEGNYDALGTMHLLAKLVAKIGIDPRRLRPEWMSSSEGSRFADLMEDFSRTVAALGPLGTGEGLGRDVLDARLERLCRSVPQLKILVRERLRVPKRTAEAYDRLYADPRTDALLDEFLADPLCDAEHLPGYAIDPERCVGCLLCLKKCPVHAIEGASKKVHVIHEERCTRCGGCYHVCPPRVRAVRKVPRGTRGQMQPSGDGSPATLHAPWAGPEGKSS